MSLLIFPVNLKIQKCIKGPISDWNGPLRTPVVRAFSPCLACAFKPFVQSLYLEILLIHSRLFSPRSCVPNPQAVIYLRKRILKNYKINSSLKEQGVFIIYLANTSGFSKDFFSSGVHPKNRNIFSYTKCTFWLQQLLLDVAEVLRC